MAELTNKNIEFLSNRELVNILQSVLNEIDAVASAGAYRSTTYLAISAIEGLCDELLTLLGKKPAQDNLKAKLATLRSDGALPKDFETLYEAPLRTYRNFMHPAREHTEVVLEKRLTTITQSVAQLALAGLNALIEMYEPLRFVANQTWHLEYGLAQVPAENTINMPQNPGDPVSLLVSMGPAQSIREMKFFVTIPPDAIFNFVYSYFSKDDFKAARIEGRERNGVGFDNGKLICTKWRTWSISDRYSREPSPQKREHSVQVILDSPGKFTLIVNGIPLELENGGEWNFDPNGRIGFMTEWGLVSIIDLQLQTR